MKKKLLTSFIIGFIVSLAPASYPYNMITVIAYPIPYNPHFGVLKIEDKSGITFNKIKIHIYDINGDDVYSGTFPGYPVIWNGRNERGTTVSPGMYIIKVEAENILTGLYGKKLIRILVQY